ncbi:MAG: LPS translocon maturation chaperone LptM [Methylophilaceae bacterium]
MKKLIFSLIAVLLLSACGAKGPLYLPEQKYPQPQQESR